MERRTACLDFRAKRVNIEAHVGDDIRFSAILKLDGVDLPVTEYSVETFIYDSDGQDVSDDSNFVHEEFDGLIKFSMDDEATAAMGKGRWEYAVVVTLINSDDYDRSYMNGYLELFERSDVV